MDDLESQPAGRSSDLQYLEISLGTRRRVWGVIGYTLFFLIISGLLVWLFFRFTASMRLALGIVTFMVAYMLVMGWMASRNPENRSQ